MARFIHIDHSLCRVGGHEYDYALNILRAAEEAGHEVILGANRRFRARHTVPHSWQVYPVFRPAAWKTVVSRGTPVLRCPSLVEHAAGHRTTTWAARVRNWFRSERHPVPGSRRTRAFADGCRRLFREIGFAAGDQVFCATFTDADLPGLEDFLAGQPRSTLATYHLLFHFDSHCGKDGGAHVDHAGCPQPVPWGSLVDLPVRLPDHRLAFYCTTAELAEQYRALSGLDFHYLPFAVSPDIENVAETVLAGRIRLTCAGGMRREKGVHRIHMVVDAISRRPDLRDQTEVLAQLSRRRLAQLRRAVSADRIVPIRPLRHPLRTEEYHELLRTTDVALFLYDPDRYRSRCSGILQEMLVAGHPVIVPAGCWLAAQIAEPNFRQAELLGRELPLLERREMRELRWEPEPGPGELSRAADAPLAIGCGWAMTTRCAVPPGSGALVASFRRHLPATAPFVRLETVQVGAASALLRRDEFLVGQRAAEPSLPVAVPVAAAARYVVARFSAPDAQRFQGLDEVTFDFLRATETSRGPLGQVGLAYCHVHQIPGLVAEIRDHFAHYVHSVRAHREWLRASLLPSRTVSTLCARSRALLAGDRRVA